MRTLAKARPEGADRDVATTFAAHHAFVRERLRGLGVPAADLDDAAQDVFIVLVRRIADYDPERPIRHWLAGMARRVARRYRERSRRDVIPLKPGRTRADVDLDDALRRAEAQDVLASFLAQLDPDRWAVFVLAEIEGLRGTEIAAELDVNLNTVYARLRSARTEFQRALRRHHAREHRGLAALLPFGLGRRAGATKLVPIVGIAVAAMLGVTLLLGRQGCAHDEEVPVARTQPAEGTVSSPAHAPVQASGDAAPPSVGGGLGGASPRPADPALPAAKTYTPPTPDAEGWYAAGSGFTTAGERTLSTESRYRFDGDRLIYETTYIGDDDESFEVAAYVDLDGLEVASGGSDDGFTLGASETRVVTRTFLATREGCVRLNRHGGKRPPPGETRAGSSRRHVFVVDRGKLRHIRDARECEPIAHPTEEALSGRMIDVDIYNDCDIATEFIVFARPDGKQPPPTLPVERIDAGEHRRIRIDAAQWILRVGSGGGVKVDGESGEVHFFGEDCKAWRAQDRAGPAPPLPK